MIFPVSLDKLNTDSEYYASKIKNLRVAENLYLSNSIESSPYPVKTNFQITDACNLQCIICPIKRPLKDPHIMSIQVLEKCAKKIFPYSILFSPTDIGEPLLYPWFNKLCLLLKNYDVLMDITTNGVLLNKDNSKQILSIASDIKISYDGFRNETFDGIRCGAKKEVVENKIVELNTIREKMAYLHKPEITVQSTILRRNISEIPDIVKMASAAGADRVKAYHLISYHPETDSEVLVGGDDHYTSILHEAFDLAKSFGISIELAEYSVPLNAVPLKRINCLNPWYQTWIDYDGNIYPCHSHSGLSCGNISNGIASTWNGDQYRRLRNYVMINKPGSICHNCGMQYQQCDNSSLAPYDGENFLSCHASSPIIDDTIRWSARTRLFDIKGRSYNQLKV